MRSYIIIYLDLVGYSKNNEPIQVDLFKYFQKQIHHILYDQIMNDECILIPTGDGIIIGLEEKNNSEYKLALNLASDIIIWTKKNNVEIRTAIHVGDVNVLIDINKNKNIVGNTINDASRMLSGADDGSIIISKAFYKKYLRLGSFSLGVKYDIDEYLSYIIVDEDTIIDKHSFEHFVYSIKIIRDEVEYGYDGKILTKFITNIYSNDYPKSENLKNRFFNKIKNCEQLTLFGIYHPSTPLILEKIILNKHRTVHIDIFYASDELKNQIKNFFSSDNDNLDFKNKLKSLDAVKKWYNENEFKKNIKLNIFEYTDFYPLGFSMVDKGYKGKGFIHISNYLPNIVPAETPYIEVEWTTNTMPPLYKFYYNYINDNIIIKNGIKKLEI